MVTYKQSRFLLKSALLINTLGWGISILGLIMPSATAFKWLAYMGCQTQYDPKLDYWLRMTAFVFCWVGALSFKAFLHPEKSKELILYLGVLNAVGGGVLILSGLKLDIPLDEFLYDSLFCLTTGAVMLIFNSVELTSQSHS